MNRYAKRLVFLLLSVALMGCAFYEPPYHYHRRVTVWGLGYADTKLSPGTWHISYRGHRLTTAQARDLALLRAAYLCSQAGYPWFRIATPNSDQGRVYGQIGVRVRYPESTMIVCGLKSATRNAFNSACLLSTLMRKYRISQADLARDMRKKGEIAGPRFDILDF